MASYSVLRGFSIGRLAGLLVGLLGLPACPIATKDDFILGQGQGAGDEEAANGGSQAAGGGRPDDAGAPKDSGDSGNATPSCDDGEKNGGESDSDCGRVCPKLCDLDKRCAQDDDCGSGLCDTNKCKEPKKN